MNQQQAQTLIGQAQQLDSFDFEAIIKRVYPGRTDLENIVISQLSLQEFLHLSKRVFGQFISRCNRTWNNIGCVHSYGYLKF